MTSFTNEEYADILMAYGRANSNAREARRVYQERYPNRRVPSHQTFTNTYRRLRETGNLWFQEPRVSIREGNVNIDERILAEFDADPTKSVRKVAAALGLGIWKVWSVLRHDGRHPFHYTPVQGMYVLLGTLDFFSDNNPISYVISASEFVFFKHKRKYLLDCILATSSRYTISD